MKFWKRWIADYRGKTQACSVTEIGVYDVLLDEYFIHESPLPASRQALYRICRALEPYEREAVDSIVQKFFYKGEDGLLHNKRADEYIEEDRTFKKAQAERGRAGAMARHNGSAHWWRSDDGVREKFIELKLQSRPGESIQQAKDRCFDELERRKQQRRS